MSAAQRLGDKNSGGAAIISTAQSTVYVDGVLLSVDGSAVAPHGGGPHASPKTAHGSSTVFAGGKPVNRTGDADTCNHTRTGGSSDVFIG